MPPSVPPPPLVTSALGLGVGAFAAVRTSVVEGTADARAAVEVTFPAPPPDWGFLVLAGVEPLLDALERLKARADELDWLVSTGVIDAAVRRRLVEARFSLDVDVAPEGTVVFPGEAVLTVEGPHWQAQLVRGLVLAALADATMVATRFARLVLAAGGVDVVEDGAATAHRLGGTPLLARAAYIGGARATTCAIAARRYRIPVVAPEPGTLHGEVDERFVLATRSEGEPPDSYVARADGIPGTAHFPRYDLVALESEGAWSPRLQVGDAGSTAGPGRKLLVRYIDAEGHPVADVDHDTGERLLRAHGGRYVDRGTDLVARLDAATSAPLRAPALRAGKRVSAAEPVGALRDRATAAVHALGPEHRRLVGPVRYPVGTTPQLAALAHELRTKSEPW
jgi:nicotinate phosphoribosyltransferase